MTDRQLATMAVIYAFIAISLLLCHLPSIKRAGIGAGLLAMAVINFALLAIAYVITRIIY